MAKLESFPTVIAFFNFNLVLPSYNLKCSSENFGIIKGGAELGCMSTTSSLSVVAGYAASSSPLLLRIKVDSPMELGADIRWLSLFPSEREVLFPPLTFLKPMFKQQIRNSAGGVVVTVKPSFPS